MTTTIDETRLNGLTFLRFVAAFYVFLFHFDLRFKPALPVFLKNIIANGAIAMPIFFMLSGFVLSYNYATKYKDFGSFYAARVARIYPAYLLCYVLSLPVLPSAPEGGLLKFAVSLAFLLAICLLLVQAWFPHLFPTWHIAGTWSVSVEMFLYATYPLTRALSRLRAADIVLVLIAFALASSVLLPSLRLSFSSGLPFSVYYITPIFRIPDFVIGAGLATLFLRLGPSMGASLPALLLIPLLGFYGHLNDGFMFFNAFLLPLVACAIYGLASADSSRLGIVRSFVRIPLIRYMGETSYSFFLLQIPLMLMVDKWPQMFSGVSVPVAFLLLVVANSVAAIASYHLVEKPGRSAILGWYHSRAAHAVVRAA